MLYYLLKSGACLAVFMLFYKAVLERQQMHVFKRFYLLGVLLVSFCIPLFTFTVYVEPATVLNTFEPTVKEAFVMPVEDIATPINYWAVALWSVYGLGVLVFGLRFLLNLSKIIVKITANQKIKSGLFTNVLLLGKVVPHSFFNFIFLEKEPFETQSIPEEVLLHEQVHASQKHSVDVLLAELLQVVFWFNPLLYFIKKDIKLNHEFLADEAVLSQGTNAKHYQQMVLAYSSDAVNNPFVASFNYSSIKKRLTVMKTHTSKTAIWLRSLIILPLLAVMVYGFSGKEEVVKGVEPKLQTVQDTITISEDIVIGITKGRDIYVNDIPATLQTMQSVLIKFNDHLSLTERQQLTRIEIVLEQNENMGLLTDIKEELRKYGFSELTITRLYKQEGATKAQIAEYNKLTKYFNAVAEKPENYTIKNKDVERVKYLYGLMTDKQRQQAESYPDFSKILPPSPPAPETPQKPANPKAGNTKNFTGLQGVIVPKQLNAHGFVEIDGKPHFYVEKENKTVHYNRYGQKVDNNGKLLSRSQTNASDVLKGQYIVKAYKDGKVVSEFKDNKPGTITEY